MIAALLVPAASVDAAVGIDPGTVEVGQPIANRIGLACTKYRETAAFWDAEIVIADPPEVEPGRFTWSVADETADACAQSDPDRSGVWVVALVGAAVVGAAGVISRHRSLRTHTKPKEQS